MIKYIIPIAVILGISIAAFSLQNPSEETEVYTVDEAVDKISQLEGENVTVNGTAVQGRAACTQRACIEEQCCNTCSAPVNLEGNTSLRLKGDEIDCSGTNCQLNCTPETGKNYLVEGNIQQAYGEISLKVYNYRGIEE